MTLQNLRLATVQNDLEEIRSRIKSGKIHISLSSHVRQRCMQIAVLGELNEDDYAAFVDYLFDKICIESGGISVTFLCTKTFANVAFRICEIIKQTEYDVVITQSDRLLTILPHKMLGSLPGGFLPSLVDQYVTSLQKLKEST